MSFYDFKDIFVKQVKDGNFATLIILYLASVISAVGISIIYLRNINTDLKEDIAANEDIAMADNTDIISADISGAVVSPGVYNLEHGSRLVDLIKLAGGLSSDASEKLLAYEINLSQKLEDSQKIYIPFKWDEEIDVDNKTITVFYDNSPLNNTPSLDTESITALDKININTAPSDQLESLPGVGPTYAQKIITNRPYQNEEELKQKSQIPSATIAKFIQEISF